MFQKAFEIMALTVTTGQDISRVKSQFMIKPTLQSKKIETDYH